MKKSAGWPIVMIMILLVGVSAEAATQVSVSHVTPPQADAQTVRPIYPPAALAAGFEGTVTLSANVLADGTVAAVELVDCDHPNLGFESAAKEALSQWVFNPAMKDGQPVESVSLVRLHFRKPGSRLKSDGWVGGGIVRSSTKLVLAQNVLNGSRDLPGASTLAIDGGTGPQHVNKPPCALGENCMYDRRGLVPNSERLVGLPGVGRRPDISPTASGAR